MREDHARRALAYQKADYMLLFELCIDNSIGG
jgi:hypothetical protein